MKYIKILFGIGVLFLLIMLLHFGTQIVMFDFWYDIFLNVSDQRFFKEKSYFVEQFVQLMMFVGILFSVFGLWFIIKQKYFNLKTSKYFKLSGVFFLITAFLDCTIAMLNYSVSKDEKIFTYAIPTDFLLLILGLGLITISKILIDGLEIKTENDLTI